MPQIRYVCLQGDPITGGGQVREGIGHDKAYIDGKEPTANGLKGWCNVCKSMGVIRCVGPRPSHAPDNIHGYKLALNGDYLICQCPKPQKLMNTSTAWEVIIDDAYIVGWDETNNFDVSVSKILGDGADFNQYFHVYNDETRMPLVGYRYEIILDDGTTVSGITDSRGLTEKIESNVLQNAILHVFEYDEPPLNPNWDNV